MRRRLVGAVWLTVFVFFVLFLGVFGRQPGVERSASQPVELQVLSPGLIAIEEERDVIWLRMEDPSKFAEAEALLRQTKGDAWVQGRRFELVDYHPHQIGDWRSILRQEPDFWDGVGGSSYLHQINRIRVDVLTLEAKDRIEAALQRLEIPRDAVLINVPEGALSEQNPLAGCQLEKRSDTDAEQVGSYRLEVSAPQVRPGQSVTLAAIGGEGELLRGVDSYLQCWTGSSWSNRYLMYSWGDVVMTHLYSPNLAIIQPATDARRPFDVFIPENLAPGWYRIDLRVLPTGEAMHLSQLIQVMP